HCFGCGAHGTAIGFVMQHDGLEFPAAIEQLAGEVGLEVPRTAGGLNRENRQQNEKLYAALTDAQTFFRNRLKRSSAAQAYLEQRGLNAQTIDEFEIGLAPDAWADLTDHLLANGHREADLEKAGLSGRSRQGNLIDRFRNRVQFPIHDRRGRVIGFGGRDLGDQGPKYLNSAETPVFHKGRELYRLFQVRRGGLPERLLVVEGYMDAAALFQFGFADAVATLGTAVTADHLELMFRATSVVVFCFDGDTAGQRAAWKGLEAALPVMRSNREVRFLFLPDGDDPDSLVRREGADGFNRLLDQAVPLSAFLFDRLSQSLDMNTPDGRARLVDLAGPLLARLPSGPFADLMADELERRAGHRGSWQSQPRPRIKSGTSERPLTPVQYSVAILVQFPELARGLALDRLEIPGELKGVNFLKELIGFCAQKPHITTAMVLEHWREAPEGPFLSGLATRNLAGNEEKLKPALSEALTRIREQLLRSRIAQLQQFQAAGGLNEEHAAELRHCLSERAAMRAQTSPS
ncbi:MAG: DNA primase, partial [Pseudomonadota bacterium]